MLACVSCDRVVTFPDWFPTSHPVTGGDSPPTPTTWQQHVESANNVLVGSFRLQQEFTVQTFWWVIQTCRVYQWIKTNVLWSESDWYARPLPSLSRTSNSMNIQMPRGLIGIFSKGEIVLKGDLSQQHYATHGLLVETRVAMFSFLCFAVKMHPGSHNAGADPHIHTNAGSATFAV